jgi:hypothetical protein
MANGVKTPERKVIGWVCLLFLLACFLPCIDCGREVPSSDPGCLTLPRGATLA